MKKIVLVACAATKVELEPNQTIAAKDLYTSNLFNKSMQYAKLLNPDAIYILSAKYGLLDPEKQVISYNEYLPDKSSSERKIWASKIIEDLKGKNYNLSQGGDEFIILAGIPYYENLIGSEGIGNYVLPLDKMRIGERLQFLNDQLGK